MNYIVGSTIIDKFSRCAPYVSAKDEYILDRLVKENNVTVMLHTSYVAALKEDKTVHTVIVENADGRGAVQAKFFIDATGDGRVARDLQIQSYINQNIQPPSSCFYLQGDTSGVNIGDLIQKHGKEFNLEDDWGWSTQLAGCKGLTMRADNHVFDVRCDRATDLTYAEIEGRRQAGALTSLFRKYGKIFLNLLF